MTRFVQIEGFTIAIDHIVMIRPAHEGKVIIQFVGDRAHAFSEESVLKLKQFLSEQCSFIS